MPETNLERRVLVLEKALDLASAHFALREACFVCPVEHCPNFLSWQRKREDCEGAIRAHLEKSAEEALDA